MAVPKVVFRYSWIYDHGVYSKNVQERVAHNPDTHTIARYPFLYLYEVF
jgi:hypothetical protein